MGIIGKIAEKMGPKLFTKKAVLAFLAFVLIFLAKHTCNSVIKTKQEF